MAYRFRVRSLYACFLNLSEVLHRHTPSRVQRCARLHWLLKSQAHILAVEHRRRREATVRVRLRCPDCDAGTLNLAPQRILDGLRDKLVVFMESQAAWEPVALRLLLHRTTIRRARRTRTYHWAPQSPHWFVSNHCAALRSLRVLCGWETKQRISCVDKPQSST